MEKTSPILPEETVGLCPTCLRDVPARLFEDSGQVWIEQSCPRHGTTRALIASDAKQYLRLRQYVPPRVSGCCCGPEDNCASAPPVCILILEITRACNLACPTCYADAGGHDFMTLEEAKRRLDSFFKEQSALDVLMLSGGEPTIHPRFIEILDIALSYPINRVLVNTNGLRIAQSRPLVDSLAERRQRLELYFSFSSFSAETQTHLYGRDLREIKTKALDVAQSAELFVNLVATVELGVNDHEIGELYRFALSHENISGLVIQPVMDTGRYSYEMAPENRMTLTGAIGALEAQTGGALRAADFVGLPCSHPDCCALTYGFLDSRREHITPLPRHLDVGRYLDLFADRISFSGLIAGALRRVWSDIAHLRAGQTLRDLTLLFGQAGIRDALPLIGNPEAMGKRVFRVVVKPFMDAHVYDQNRIAQCCTKILTEEGRAVSFCEYNVFHRGRAPKTGALLNLTMVK
jgi:uncharacterized radical SAM superfamily Fe-S cluster-containing enzyme